MWSAATMVLAASITCARSARPPISCRTLGRRDLRRVPLPAAMMTTPKELVSIRLYPLTSRDTRNEMRETRLDRAAELEDGGTEALELVGAKAADGAKLREGCGRSEGDVAEDCVAEDEEGGKSSGVSLLLAPGAEARIERGLRGVEFGRFDCGLRRCRFADRRWRNVAPRNRELRLRLARARCTFCV